ncbi:MAG: glycogen/starch synthase [Spirochaetales bacterium]|nr:glycogen/starch synthase [Spirochaetales bacterium]
MKVYQVSREFYPFANAGGLKEVVTGIALALNKVGIESSVFIPRYGFIQLSNLTFVKKIFITLNKVVYETDIFTVEYNGVHVYFIDNELVASKNDVYTYTELDEKKDIRNKKGEGFLDTEEINILFQLSVLEFITNNLPPPNVLSLHDGHTGLIPGLIKSNNRYSNFFSNSKIFFTIHNAGFAYHQRLSAKKIVGMGIIDDEILKTGCFEDILDPICLAISYAIPLTVSPYYSEEILQLQHEESSGGFGLFCQKNSISIHGITNGVELNHYKSIGITSPPSDIIKIEMRNSLSNIILNTKDIQKWGNMDFSLKRPLYLFQNRITEQKGIQVLIDAFKDYFNSGGDSLVLVMGAGERRFENELIAFTEKYPGKICYLQGYNETLAKKAFIASNFFILTSLWEPCGLTDFEAQLGGSIPIVNNTGGLKKVIHGRNGFIYNGLKDLVNRLYLCDEMYYVNPSLLIEMGKFAYNHIAENYTWDKVVEKQYLPIFRS